MKRKKWTPDEIEFMKVFYLYFTAESLSKVLKRSKSSLTAKAYDLDLEKRVYLRFNDISKCKKFPKVVYVNGMIIRRTPGVYIGHKHAILRNYANLSHLPFISKKLSKIKNGYGY